MHETGTTPTIELQGEKEKQGENMAPAGKLIVARQQPDGQVVHPENAPKELLQLAEKLKPRIKQHEAIFMDNRGEYFLGRRAVDALFAIREEKKQKQQDKKNEDQSSSKDEFTRDKAHLVMESLIENGFFFKVNKQSGRALAIDTKNQQFTEDGYYIWQWTPRSARLKQQLLSYALVVGVLAVVMFPLWPNFMRVGVWYLSMAGIGFVSLLFIIALLRVLLFGLTAISPGTRPGLWLFPNLFADVGFLDSFVPIWGWHGVDYEKQHIEKYRKQRGGGNSKKLKSGSSDSERSPEKVERRRSLSKNSSPILDRVSEEKLSASVKSPMSDDNDEDFEDIEEINAD